MRRAALVAAIAALVAPETAIAAQPACYVPARARIAVDAENALESQWYGRIVGDGTYRLALTIDTYRRGELVYHDEMDLEATAGPMGVGAAEQLPLSWKGERLVVRIRLVACGRAYVRRLVVTTAQEPTP